jgi:hypothetical protein
MRFLTADANSMHTKTNVIVKSRMSGSRNAFFDGCRVVAVLRHHRQ